VRCSAPASPVLQSGGDHPAQAVVRGLLEMFAAAVVKTGESSEACASIIKTAGPPSFSSAWNCR
jgi:hypothetical protein